MISQNRSFQDHIRCFLGSFGYLSKYHTHWPESSFFLCRSKDGRHSSARALCLLSCHRLPLALGPGKFPPMGCTTRPKFTQRSAVNFGLALVDPSYPATQLCKGQGTAATLCRCSFEGRPAELPFCPGWDYCDFLSLAPRALPHSEKYFKPFRRFLLPQGNIIDPPWATPV